MKTKLQKKCARGKNRESNQKSNTKCSENEIISNFDRDTEKSLLSEGVKTRKKSSSELNCNKKKVKKRTKHTYLNEIKN